MKRISLYIYIICSIGLFACSESIQVDNYTEEEAAIFPDYKDVTIPQNIAPLNFCLTDVPEHTELALLIEGEGSRLQVKGKKQDFVIPEKAWHTLLETVAGKSLQFTVCRKVQGCWQAYRPFSVQVVSDPVDPYVSYRLIAPGYELWNKMGIYQRNVETYEQTPIYENRLTDYNCVNCHSFRMQDPAEMLFHMRAAYGGTVLLGNKGPHKLNTKTPETIGNVVYPYWHPEGRYIAFSVNSTLQSFFTNHPNRIEVYDTASDVVVLDKEAGTLHSSPLLSSDTAFETFPSFSPDGKSLYFCSAQAVDSLPDNYKQVHYSLCRIDFHAENGTFGQQVDTLFNAMTDTLSASFPRVSPDGKLLVFTRHGFGNFSIWHKDADLWAIRLADGVQYPLTEVNSEDVESYHSWSSNSRWMVFSSRRIDGLYTRLFFTYIDPDGHAHKPFLLPQKYPKKYYEDLMYSYNIPESMTGPAVFDSRAIADEMRHAEGRQLTFRK